MKVLVTGSSGQLGFDVCRTLEKRQIDYCGVSSKQLQITDLQAVEAFFDFYQPDAVIHCAAWTAVDQAEIEPQRAFAVNEIGTRNIAASCKKAGAKMIYTSTDYVFPGIGEQFYETDDETGPKNIYGKSKLAGEQAIREILDCHFIVRISWVFGINGNNFVQTMLRLAETKQEISVVCDQIGSPTYTTDLAPLLCDMLTTDRYGTYHATNEGVCSWAEFAQVIFDMTGYSVHVKPILSSEYHVQALRPLNSRLSKQSLRNGGFLSLPDWKDALQRHLQSINCIKTNPKELK